MSNQDNPQALVAEAEQAGEALARVRAEIGKAVFGQERVIELTLAAVLAGGPRFAGRRAGLGQDAAGGGDGAGAWGWIGHACSSRRT